MKNQQKTYYTYIVTLLTVIGVSLFGINMAYAGQPDTKTTGVVCTSSFIHTATRGRGQQHCPPRQQAKKGKVKKDKSAFLGTGHVSFPGNSNGAGTGQMGHEMTHVVQQGNGPLIPR